MKAVHVPTQQDYDTLMRALEKKGYYWPRGALPHERNEWVDSGTETWIEISQKELKAHSEKFYRMMEWNLPVERLTLAEALHELNLSDVAENARQMEKEIAKLTYEKIPSLNLIPMEKTLENLEVGDLVKNSDGRYRKVLATLNPTGEGRVYFVSDWSRNPNNQALKLNGYMTTITSLREDEWVSYSPSSPVKMTLAEVSAKLGHEVEIVK